MLLGELIARFDDETVAAETLLLLEDLALATRVREASTQEQLSAGEFASMAVQRFSTHATDEEWLTIMGQISRSKTPGLELLRRSLLWILNSRSACCDGISGR